MRHTHINPYIERLCYRCGIRGGTLAKQSSDPPLYFHTPRCPRTPDPIPNRRQRRRITFMPPRLKMKITKEETNA